MDLLHVPYYTLMKIPQKDVWFGMDNCTSDCLFDLSSHAGLEPRILTRWDMHAFARQAYDMGVRYIGGCCGFEPYHVRALSEELIAERGGRIPEGCEKHDMWGAGLKMHTKPWVRAR